MTTIRFQYDSDRLERWSKSRSVWWKIKRKNLHRWFGSFSLIELRRFLPNQFDQREMHARFYSDVSHVFVQYDHRRYVSLVWQSMVLSNESLPILFSNFPFTYRLWEIFFVFTGSRTMEGDGWGRNIRHTVYWLICLALIVAVCVWISLRISFSLEDFSRFVTRVFSCYNFVWISRKYFVLNWSTD